jgi:hypothetical protein
MITTHASKLIKSQLQQQFATWAQLGSLKKKGFDTGRLSYIGLNIQTL